MSDDVLVEFFGVPRLRAGRSEVRVEAGRVADILRRIVGVCPGLADLVRADGRLTPHYLLSVDGQRFVTDMDEAVRPGERLLLLSADAGG